MSDLVHSDAQESAVIPTELVARLEVAERGSPDLDMAISEATGQWWMAHPDQDVAGPWTQSLDAALSLAERVLPTTWRGPIDLSIAGSAEVYLNATDPCGPHPAKSFGNTPALALCIAVLKARTASSVGTSGASEP